MAEYVDKMYDVEQIPAPDSLVAGGRIEVSVIKLTGACEYVRGEVLMSSGDSFVKATSGGISSAEELCIVCKNITLNEGDEVEMFAYFGGHFNGQSLVYDDSIDMADLESAMRKHGIYIR